MKRLRCLATLGAVIMLQFGTAHLSATADVAVHHRGVNAKPIERKPPRYPVQARQTGTEGWVLVSFIVDVDGSVKDIEILDTSIENYFEKPSLRAIEQWTYEPATIDGQPVPQAKTEVRLLFIFEGSNGGVRPHFNRRYKQAVTAIQEEDFETAEALIEELEEKKKRLIAEVGYLDVLKGTYWLAKGVEWKALRFYERALTIADNFPETNTYRNLLHQSFVLSVRQNYLLRAIRHYNRMVEVGGDLKPDDPVRQMAERIQIFLDGDTPFATQVKIFEPCSTCQEGRPFGSHSLYRNRFAITEIDGRIGELKLLCGFQNVTLAFEPDMMWNIEADWGQCDVHIYGDAGTTFKLVEYQRPHTD